MKVLRHRGEQPSLVLGVDLEVVLVPEHQIASTILVVVDLVDTALAPGVVSIAVGSQDPTHVGGGADLHWMGERAALHLDEHPEAVDVRHHQVVAVVAVHVPSDVYMGDFASARRVEVGSNRHQRAFRRRFGIEPVQAVALVRHQPVAPADVGHVDEQHFGTERCVESRRPGAGGERVDAQAAVVVLVDVHHGKFRHRATEKKSRQNGLAFRGADDDLVLFKEVVRNLRNRRRHASR